MVMSIFPEYLMGVCGVLSSLSIFICIKESSRLSGINAKRQFAINVFFSFYSQVEAQLRSIPFPWGEDDFNKKQTWDIPLQNAYNYLLQATDGAEGDSINYPDNLNPYTLNDYTKNGLEKLNEFLDENNSAIREIKKLEVYALVLSLLAQLGSIFVANL